MTARRSKPNWFRKNTVALAALVITVPVLGWWSTRSDYNSWYDSEPRDPVVVAAGGTAYQDATWYNASVEVDPQPKSSATPEPPPEGTTRVRVYLRIRVDNLAALGTLGGCRVHLRAPDGRIWDESNLESAFQDRPTGCGGGSDDKAQSWRNPRIAQYYVTPQAGKPFETVAVFVVPTEVAESAQPTITWATKLPEYLAFRR